MKSWTFRWHASNKNGWGGGAALIIAMEFTEKLAVEEPRAVLTVDWISKEEKIKVYRFLKGSGRLRYPV